MSLSQTQIIRSLGNALTWLESELQWGVEPGELNHLIGRIGELYVAMRTCGQMALAVNQKGYDVVSATGEQISVKTVTTSKSVRFNKNTFDQVHRVVVLRINYGDDLSEGENISVDDVSIEEIIDEEASKFLSLCKEQGGKYKYSLPSKRKVVPLEQQKPVKQVVYGPYEVVKYESGSIQVKENGVPVRVVKPALRDIAKKIGMSIVRENGRSLPTRQLGSKIIDTINELNES